MARAKRVTGMIAAFCGATAALGSAAQARTIYIVQVDIWHVYSLTNSCIAYNRPINDYNQSPYNSLTLHAPKGGGLLVGVAFWPGLFTAGSPYKLALRADPGDRFQVDVKAAYDYDLKSVDPLPAELVQQLAKAKFVTVRVADVPATLAFDTTRMREVLDHLDHCRGLIEEG